MIFWIAVCLISLVLLIGFIATARDYWDWGWFLGSAGIGFLMLFVGALVVGIGASAVASKDTPTLADTWTLRALVTEDATEGHAGAVFFLGFGYASSDSTTVSSISYIQTAKDGGSTLRKASIEQSIIYEDGDKKPYVEDWVTVTTSDPDHIWVPWDMTRVVGGEPLHRFHIPAGSILESYEVTP